MSYKIPFSLKYPVDGQDSDKTEHRMGKKTVDEVNEWEGLAAFHKEGKKKSSFLGHVTVLILALDLDILFWESW